jgi:hypothetical protein
MLNTDYVYFMYSGEQIKEKNTVLEKSNKKFRPGTVVVNGQRKEFTQIVKDTSKMSRFVDAVIVCEGILGDNTFTNPDTY